MRFDRWIIGSGRFKLRLVIAFSQAFAVGRTPTRWSADGARLRCGSAMSADGAGTFYLAYLGEVLSARSGRLSAYMTKMMMMMTASVAGELHRSVHLCSLSVRCVGVVLLRPAAVRATTPYVLRRNTQKTGQVLSSSFPSKFVYNVGHHLYKRQK